MDREERDRQMLRRRLEVLALPVTPLRRNGFIGYPPDSVRMEHAIAHSPVVGVGPDGELLAFFHDHLGGGSWGAVTRTTTGARGDASTIEVHDALRT